MKKLLLAALLLAPGLGAWSQTKVKALPPAMEPIVVQVADGQVSVSNGSMQVAAGQTSLQWQMGTAGYRFPAGAVDFGAARGQFKCDASTDGQQYRCTRTTLGASGEVPYTLTVTSTSTGSALRSPEPYVFIFND